MIDYTPGRSNNIVIEIMFGHRSLENMKLLRRARTGTDDWCKTFGLYMMYLRWKKFVLRYFVFDKMMTTTTNHL